VKRWTDFLPTELQDLVSQVVRIACGHSASRRHSARLWRFALADNRQEELLNATVKLAAEAVRNNRDLIRERVRAETPWWVPPVVDDKIYQKIIAAGRTVVAGHGDGSAHPLRTAFDDAIRDFIERLQHSPEVNRACGGVERRVAHGAQTDELARKLWEGIREAVSKHATGTDGATGPSPLDSGLSEFGIALLSIPRCSPTSTICSSIDSERVESTGTRSAT